MIENSEIKFKFTEEIKILYHSVLHRIIACKSFGDVKCGDLGGWLEFDSNLSQDGNCWIYDNAIVMDNAIIKDNAKAYDISLIHGNAIVQDIAEIRNMANVGSHATICGNSIISNSAKICGSAVIKDKVICGNVELH